MSVWSRPILFALAASGLSLPAAANAQKPTFSTSVRARAESWNWFESRADGDYVYLGVLARSALSQQTRRIGWRVELAVPLLLGLPQDPVAPAPQGQLGAGAAYWAANDSATNAAGIFLKQAFLRWGGPGTARGSSVRLGRFEFIDGTETTPSEPILASLKRDRIAHRLIGNFGWSHVQRSFDGVHYAYDGADANLTLLALRPVQGVFNANGWPELNIVVAYGALNRRAHAAQQSDWRIFSVYYRDYRAEPAPLKVDNRSFAQRQLDQGAIAIGTFGGHYLRIQSLGPTTIDLLSWGALQTGHWGLLNHRAYALSAELGVQAVPTASAWLRFGYTRSSGDRSATDDEHGTFFQLLPTPRWYARFPLYNLMNTEDLFGAIVLGSGARINLRAEAHRLALTQAADLWYAGGGAFESGSFGFAGRPSNGQTHLGTLLDLSAAYRWSPALSLNGYLGWTKGGSVIDAIHPAGNEAVLGYLEVEWRR